MKFLSAAAVAMFAATPVLTSAAPFLLDFEAVTSFDPIGGLYAGSGISFTGDALGLTNDALGPYFSNAPSPVGVMTPVGADATMNVAEGLIYTISFFYTSSAVIANGVQVWSGLDGTGNLLAAFDLAANAQTGCTDTAYCHFDQLSASFAGIAHSVTFGNAASNAAFDDVSVATVPEPATALMIPLALAGLLVTRRRA